MANFRIPSEDTQDDDQQPAKFERRRSPKTSELIARELANEIIKRDLPEGTALPPEKDMIERYGVGRTTLREALRLLETRGVLTIRVGPRGGPVVRRPKATDLSDALTLILQFKGATLWDVFQAHCAIQPMVARLAASKVGPSEIAELRAILERMKEEVQDPDRFTADNEQFQEVLLTAAGTVTLQVLAEGVSLISLSTIAGVPYPTEEQQDRTQYYERLLDALEHNNPEAAEQAVRQYLEKSGAHWLEHYQGLVNLPVRWTS